MKAEALHGFVLCNDGRLYHTFLCKMALEAHAEMLRFEARRERDRARKSKGAGEINTDAGAVTEADDDAAGDGETIPTDGAESSEGIPAESAGQDSTRQNLTSPKAPKHGGYQKSGGVVSRRTRRQSTPATPAGIGGVTDDGHATTPAARKMRT